MSRRNCSPRSALDSWVGTGGLSRAACPAPRREGGERIETLGLFRRAGRDGGRISETFFSLLF